MFNNWSKYGIVVPTGRYSGNVKVFCPKCHDQRKDKRDRSLSVNLATGEFHCFYCDFKGCAAEEDEWEKQQRKAAWHNQHPVKQKKNYRRPTPKPVSPYSAKLLAYMKGRGISEDTLKALKVSEGMEWMPQVQGEMNTVQFNYYLNGELVNTKFRTGNKHFKFVTGAELLPYNIDSIKDTDSVIITEGEMDALTFYELGHHNVVSAPSGANVNLEWMDDYWDEYFENKKLVYIASDTDTKGVIMRDALLHRFGAELCRVVEYGDDCKDANDLLQKHGREAVENALSCAKEVKIEGVFSVSDFEGSLDALYQNGMQRGVTIGHDNFDALCSFETKRLCIVTGIPGSGKSEFIDEIAERLNIRYGWRWAFFSPENAPLSYHASKLIEKFVGKKFGHATMPLNEYTYAKQHLENDFSFISPADNFKLDNILAKARSLVRRRGIKALVIDPYNRLESEMGTRSETLYVSEVLDKLSNFAQLNDVLVVLMAHPTKLQKDKQTGQIAVPTLYDIAGSANFYNKADFGLVVHRDRAEGYTIVNIAKVKFRHLGEPGRALFKYNLNNGRYVPFEVGQTEVDWDNTNHLIKARTDAEQAAMDAAQLEFDNDDLDFSPSGNKDEVPF